MGAKSPDRYEDDPGFGPQIPREPPHSIQAENAIIGAIMLNRNCLDLIEQKLQPWHFYVSGVGRIYRVQRQLLSEPNGVADPVTLRMYFESDGTLNDVGGARFLGELAASGVSIMHIEAYADLVVEHWKRRQIIEAAHRLLAGADGSERTGEWSDMVPIDDLLAQHDAVLTEIGQGLGPAAAGAKPLSVYAENVVRGIEQQITGQISPGVRTRLIDFDNKHGELYPGDLVVLAGRPSMGKTRLLWKFAHAAALEKPDEAVLICSIEMPGEQLVIRDIASASDYSMLDIRRAKFDPDQFDGIRDIARQVSRPKIYVDDRAKQTVASIRNEARRLKRQHGLSLIGVDYLQLMAGEENRNQRGENRVQELSAITRGLKIVARELEVPLVLLSQLSRQVEMREDKRPQLQDLRDSGSIEQDADSVAFVYRDSYYIERNEPKRRIDDSDAKFADRHSKWEMALVAAAHKADIIIGKARHGPGGTIQVYYSDRDGFDNLSRY